MAESTKNTVLTKEEMKNLTSLQQEQNDLIFSLGQADYQLEFMESRKEEIYQKLGALEGKQTTEAKVIEEKYGQGSVNLETGEFIKS